ncbi:hypothetical protein H9P43_004976 [Blastocladiella emersonii ATCC 22665]|nr:hypothetical protein H9P43_004976 [Blastocladiella emersonii ATCC 22665]
MNQPSENDASGGAESSGRAMLVDDDLGALEATEQPDLTVEKVLASIKNGLFGVLFVVIKESTVTPFMVVVSMVIDIFQVFSFTFNFNWDANTNWFQSVINGLALDDAVLRMNGQVSFYLMLSVLSITFLNAAYVGYSFYRNHIRFIWTLKTLRTLLTLCSTVLYIPIVGVFAENIVSCKAATGESVSCFSGNYLPTTIIAITLGVIFIILTFIVTATFFEQEAGGKDILARPHARADLLHTAIRTYLTIIFSVLQQNSSQTAALHSLKEWELWLLVISVVVGSSASTFMFAYYMPYYRYRYVVLQTALLAAWNFSSLVLLYWNIRPSARVEMGILYFVFAPVYVLLVVSLQFVRRRWLLVTDVRQLSDPLSIELKARIHLEEKGLLFKLNDTQVADTAGAPTPLNDLATFEKVKDINAMWADAARRMPDNALLYLFWAEFYLITLRNKHMALTYYGRSEEKSSALDVQFLVFRRRKILSSENAGAGDAINLIAYEQHLNMATRYQSNVTRSQIKFWGELLKKTPDMARLHVLADSISDGISKAQDNYIRVLKINPGSAQVLRMYAAFLIEIMNDHKNGRELQERADDLDEHGEGEDGDGDEEGADIDLFNDQNSVITISGAYETVGKILHVNNKALSLLGYRRGELLNQNITTIIPEPFAEPHDAFMRRYLETGFSKIVERTRKVLARQRTGYLIPVMLAVKQVNRNKTTAFLGVLKPLHSEEDFIMMDERENTTGFTEGVTKWFQVHPRELEGGNLHISQILPRYRELHEQYKSRNGATTNFSTKDGRIRQIEVQMSVTELPRPDGTAGVLRMTMAVFRVSEDVVVKSEAMLAGGSDSQILEGMSTPGSIAHESVASTNLSRKRDIPMGFMDDAEAGSSSSSLDRGSGSKDGAGGGNEGGAGKRRRAPSEAGQSVARSSRSAASSGASGSSPEFVKSVLIRKNIIVTKNLRWLRLSFVSAILILVGLAIRGHLVTIGLYEQHATRLIQIASEHTLGQLMISVAYAVRTLDLVNGGQIASTGAAAARTWATGQLSTALAQMQNTVQTLSSSLSNDAFYTQYYTLSKVAVSEFSAAGNSTVTLGLLDAVNRVQSTASLILASPTFPLQRHVDFVAYNGPLILPTALSNHTDAFRSTFTLIAQALNVEIGVAMMPIALYLLTVFLLIRPIYTTIQHERDGFLAMFGSIPRHVVKAIQEQWVRRYEKMMGDGEDQQSQSALTNAVLGTLVGGNKSISAASLPGASGLYELAASRKSSLAAAAAGRRVSTFNDTSAATQLAQSRDRPLLQRIAAWIGFLRAQVMQAVHRKYLMMFVLTVAYFVASSLMAFDFQSTALSQSEEVKWSTRISVLARQVTYYTREAVASPPSPFTPKLYVLGELKALNDEIGQITQALIYGNATMGVAGVTGSPESDINVIFLSNACGLEYQSLVAQAIEVLSTQTLAMAALDTSDPFATLWQFDYVHFPPILNAVGKLYLGKSTDGLASFYRIHLILTVIYAAVMLILYLVYYRPHITQLGSSIMRKHVMLFLIPTDVITNVESIQRYLRS